MRLSLLGVTLSCAVACGGNDPGVAAGSADSTASAASSAPPVAGPDAAALDALLMAEQKRVAVEVRPEHLASHSAAVRIAAARALARIGGEGAQAGLLKLLGDDHPDVVTWAAYGLGFWCKGHDTANANALTARAVSLLADAAQSKPKDAADKPKAAPPIAPVQAIARAIGACAAETSEATLVAWLASSRDVAEAASLGIGELVATKQKLREETVVALLQRASGSAAEPPLPMALYPLGRLDHPPPSTVDRLREVAIASLAAPGPLRLFAVRALGRAGDDAAPALGHVVATPGDFTAAERGEASRALQRLGRAGQRALADAVPGILPPTDPVALTGLVSEDFGATLAALEAMTEPGSAEKSLREIASRAPPPAPPPAVARRLSWLRCTAAKLVAGKNFRDPLLASCEVKPSASASAAAPSTSAAPGASSASSSAAGAGAGKPSPSPNASSSAAGAGTANPSLPPNASSLAAGAGSANPSLSPNAPSSAAGAGSANPSPSPSGAAAGASASAGAASSAGPNWRDPSIGARAIVDVIGRAEITGARLAAWRSYADGPDVRAREAAIGLLEEHEEIENAAPTLARALAEHLPGVVGAAAEILTKHPERAAEAPPSKKRKKRGKNRDKDAKDDKSDGATIAIGAPSQAVVKALLAQLDHKSDADPELDDGVIDAAAALGLKEAVPRIEDACKSPYPTTREHAAKAIALLTGKKVECAAPEGGGPVPNEMHALATARTKLVFETDAGELTMTLDPALAPVAVTRFVELAKSGYYDHMVVHRVVAGFVTQFGAPFGDGSGGPEGKPPLRCETSPLAFEPMTVGVALAGRDTGSSQLFVMHGRFPHLDGKYALVGTASGPWAAFVDGDLIQRTRVAE